MPTEATHDVDRRRSVMRLCAEATVEELSGIVRSLGSLADFRDVRRPESGLVMVRGRAGGDGRAFNLGEATVTRAVVAADGMPSGFAYHLGRNMSKARHAAIVDALWQSEGRRDEVEAALAPVRQRMEADRDLAARRTAATRVDFFTLVRGED